MLPRLSNDLCGRCPWRPPQRLGPCDDRLREGCCVAQGATAGLRRRSTEIGGEPACLDGGLTRRRCPLIAAAMLAGAAA